MIGTTLGPYKILELLGAGGMGEVYLGEDTRLGRKVAIKVLPPEFASDPERLARFEQEARAAAALNHPHIAVVHDVGSEAAKDGTTTHFMVQEYLQGQSLRERLDKGALPLDKALDLATEVGEALIAAHRAGIIHRDLKPDNIFVTRDSHAKVLDFGLAKLTEGMTPTGTSASMSPTMLGTVAGQVMGTAGYMAPEQIQGDVEIDQRADLFSFGCVLYEMIAGKRAFGGETVLDTLHAIARSEPQPLSEIKPDLPAELHRTLRKCLAKDAGRRYQAADEIVVDLQLLREDIAAGTAMPEGGQPTIDPVVMETTSGIPWRVGVAAAVGLMLVTMLATWVSTRPAPPTPELPVHFDIELPEGVDFTDANRRSVAISPDGSWIVFVANDQLWMRPIDDRVPTPIPGTANARGPFFSPDSQKVGFEDSESNQLKWVAVSGGSAPVPIGTMERMYGASWADNDMIYFGRGAEGIWQVAAAGGTPEVVFEVQDNEQARSPQLLPGGEWVLFTLWGATGQGNESSIVAQSLITRARVVLVERGIDGRWVPTGHLVYVLDGTLFAVAFDPGTMERPTGPVSMVGEVRVGRDATAHYGISENGSLVYVPGQVAAGGFQLAWVDFEGQVDTLPFEPRGSFYVDLSPDGRRIALGIFGDDGPPDIWIYEVDRPGSGVPLATDGANRFPVWSHDGDWVFFASRQGGNWDIWKRRADRSADAELVLDMETPVAPTSISADGKMLLFDGAAPPSDIGILDLDTLEWEMHVSGPVGDEFATEFSPDGDFFTFHSDETGQSEQWVQEVATGRQLQVSTSIRGGYHGRWSPDGSKIYYGSSNGEGLLVVDVDMEAFSADVPSEISTIARRFRSNIEIDNEGQRLLVTTRAGDGSDQATATPRINVILNWFEDLKQRVPTRR